ncbi:Pentatricopeptide repeat [Macleaya cordata]|uniref:Pentatricopeptide repeat n=1 Tax=Macleaya cordata TaxID=56857 RepID=A0A200QP00_MACCD|nr:Pentatricopeptide repeat [Macleaya cordata]
MIRKTEKSASRSQRSSLWQRCTNFRTLKQIHAFMIINGFNSDPSAVRELMYTCAIAITGAMDFAHRVFDQITEPDIFMWNTMIRGSAQSSNPFNAISLYTQMEKKGIPPDNFTFPFVLKACTKLSWIKMGNQIHGRIVKIGLESNTFVRNTLIHLNANCGDLKVARFLFEGSAKRDVVAYSALTAGYARRGELGIARQLFDEMPTRDLVSWNVMITGYAKCGDMESARKLFDEVPQRDVVTWNAMIAGYVLSESHEQAFEMFEEMQSVGERPDEVTMLSLLSACTDSGALDIGERIHCSLIDMGRNLSVLIGNALVDMYAKCGSIEKAIEVFRGMKEKDVSTWNSIIGGLAVHGFANESIDLFTEMQREKIRPNEITFVGVLVACSHGGMVEKGRKYFDLMRTQYGIEPNIRHYGCMVDLLGRAGLLEEAFEFVESMEIEPNPIIWRTLLGACSIQGNVELGKRANERLLALRRDQSGDYVLLSNIYASEGQWEGAEKVRKLMDDRGVRKEPGCSLIEADDKKLMHFLFDSKPKLNSSSNVL